MQRYDPENEVLQEFDIPPDVESEEVEVYSSVEVGEEEALEAEAGAVPADPALNPADIHGLLCDLSNLVFSSEHALSVPVPELWRIPHS